VKVVAEGVETAAQHAFLRETGCDVHQGYLFSRPQPPAQFAAFALALQARQSQQDDLATGSAI
jgi:EAL domain-containing protein (putative c-di-GMP-specific phosphodiesterase class I)